MPSGREKRSSRLFGGGPEERYAVVEDHVPQRRHRRQLAVSEIRARQRLLSGHVLNGTGRQVGQRRLSGIPAPEHGHAVVLDHVRHSRRHGQHRVPAVRAHERVPVVQVDQRVRRGQRAARVSQVLFRERLSVGHRDVQRGRAQRTRRLSEVRARKRLSLERVDVRQRREQRPPDMSQILSLARLPLGPDDPTERRPGVQRALSAVRPREQMSMHHVGTRQDILFRLYACSVCSCTVEVPADHHRRQASNAHHESILISFFFLFTDLRCKFQVLLHTSIPTLAYTSAAGAAHEFPSRQIFSVTFHLADFAATNGMFKLRT